MRPDILIPLFASVQSFQGIGAKLSMWLEKLCGRRVIDVLWHLPTGLNERPVITQAPIEPHLATLQMTVMGYEVPHHKKQPYVVFGSWVGGEIQLLFFNYHASFLNKKFIVGRTLWVSGTVIQERGVTKILHPDYVEAEKAKIPELESVYPLKAGANGKVVRRLIEQILPTLPNLAEESPSLVAKYGWPSWKEAMCQVHQPKTQADLLPTNKARMRLAFDELLADQVALQLVRRYNKREMGLALPFQNNLVLQLPFSLTHAQIRCLKEIREDMESPERMTRLLQGDVGSGKTIVAVLAALQAVENGAQVAFLAPTDILAHQHYEKVKTFCALLKVNVGLLTGREKGRTREALLQEIVSGKVDILIGTHALLEENVVFKKLGLAIIDEQHRFGVRQRLALAEKEKGVNVLAMTATPIPRTLALTAYGDMDVSILNEKPAGRQPIETCVMPLSEVERLMMKLKENDSQVYWVCPLVADSESSDLMAAEKRYQSLQKIFGSQVGLIHGQMKAVEKDAAMTDFINGKTKILVSTTVIEVGVDVPSAGVMVVEHAERFGLATLHQLRGRVGRGREKAVCLLLYGRLSETGRERLKVLRESEDGFKIAEADLRLRGAGEVLGIRQSGLPLFHLADLSLQGELLEVAHEEAIQILKEDPKLETNRGQAVKNMLYLFSKEKELYLLKAG